MLANRYGELLEAAVLKQTGRGKNPATIQITCTIIST
jgi:hypothetical protein